MLRFWQRLWGQKKFSSKQVFSLFSFIFVLWSIYRYFPGLVPEWVEDWFLKPLVWLGPTFFIVFKVEKEKFSSLGFRIKNLFPALYWGIGLGFVFALEGLLTNIFKYRGLNLIKLDYSFWGFLGALASSFMVAFSEETVFRGYIFNRLWKIWQKEWWANLVSAGLFSLIHLPIGLFVLGYKPLVMLAYLFLVFVYGFGAAFVFARTKNLTASILLHVFWSWPIVLFR